MSEQFSQDQNSTVSSSDMTDEDLQKFEREPIPFQTHFQGIMDMFANIETVRDYLNHHEGWFVRCASPMKAEPFGDNGYTLTIGHYGSFGYELDPRMTVVFNIPKEDYYVTNSIPNPNAEDKRYTVDYQSTMDIKEISTSDIGINIEKIYKKHNLEEIPTVITRIHWQLDLKVEVKFPNFIYKLPLKLIKSTGDRLLTEIVKQISPRLSYKVQNDFHTGLKLPIPPKKSRTCEKIKS